MDWFFYLNLGVWSRLKELLATSGVLLCDPGLSDQHTELRNGLLLPARISALLHRKDEPR